MVDLNQFTPDTTNSVTPECHVNRYFPQQNKPAHDGAVTHSFNLLVRTLLFRNEARTQRWPGTGMRRKCHTQYQTFTRAMLFVYTFGLNFFFFLIA